MIMFLRLNTLIKKRINTIQYILYCHPQLDWGSQYLIKDSRFHGNDSRTYFSDRFVVFLNTLKNNFSASHLNRGKLLLIFLIIFSSCSNPYKNLTKTELELNQINETHQ